MLQLLRRALPWVFAAGLFMSGWHMGAKEVTAHWQEEIHNDYVKKTEAQRATQKAVGEIAARYQEEIAALEGSTDRIIDDLHNDNVRLSVRIKNLRATSGGTSGCQPNGRAELDDRDAKRIIGVTQRGDAWIKALQDTIRELQKEK